MASSRERECGKTDQVAPSRRMALSSFMRTTTMAKGMAAPTNELTPPKENRFRYQYDPNFAAILESLEASLLVTTYQAGKLIALRSEQGRMSMLLRSFGKAMGLAVAPGMLALATATKVWTFRNSPSVAAKLGHRTTGSGRLPPDACYLPRMAHVTGAIDAHEVAFGGREIWVVNTDFSALCTLDPCFSFVPRWKPPFVSKLAREDRCHLNGLAMVEGRPRFVTAFGETDSLEGWRPGKRDGGCVIDVPTGRAIVRGLAMPHSPRVYAGALWILESGQGRLLRIDPGSGRRETIIELPGYTRGLDFAGRLAFIGLSKLRERDLAEGVPVAERIAERPCGVAVVDVVARRRLAQLDFLDDIREVFDVRLLTGARRPMVAGLGRSPLSLASVIGPWRDVEVDGA